MKGKKSIYPEWALRAMSIIGFEKQHKLKKLEKLKVLKQIKKI